MPSRPTRILSLVLLAACGCASPRGTEILEARLRQREDQLRDLQAKLQRAESELSIARKDAAALRSQLAAGGEPVLGPEQARSLYSVAGIRIGRLMTGSVDRDGKPGRETLATVMTPHDEQGSPVKIAGDVELHLLDLSRPDGQQRIGSWRFDPEQVRAQWHGGLFGSGYLFHLPWQRVPRSSKVLLHARLTTADGRQFDADLDINVDPSRIVAQADPPDLPDRSLPDQYVTEPLSPAGLPEEPSPEEPVFRRASRTRSFEIGRRPAADMKGGTVNGKTGLGAGGPKPTAATPDAEASGSPLPPAGSKTPARRIPLSESAAPNNASEDGRTGPQ